jgi:phage terminase large subunit-like protein
MALDGLYIPRDAKWFDTLRAELLTFPASSHDDQVDALGLVGQLLDYMVEGSAAKKDVRARKASDYSAERYREQSNVVI